MRTLESSSAALRLPFRLHGVVLITGIRLSSMLGVSWIGFLIGSLLSLIIAPMSLRQVTSTGV
jgi:hypothetical protein